MSRGREEESLAVVLVDFEPEEEAMFHRSLEALQYAGYDVGLCNRLQRVEMPSGFRGMTLDDGAILSPEAFSSQAMLDHVLEEELRHLAQKAQGQADQFGFSTARTLEDEVDVDRQFPAPSDRSDGKAPTSQSGG